MESALRSLRRFVAAGGGDEGVVFRAAAVVPRATQKAVIAEGEAGDELDHDGVTATELYTWGQATNYQLGFTVLGDGQLLPRFVSLPLPPCSTCVQVAEVSCGRFHSVAISACGAVFCWGFAGNSGSRLGVVLPDGNPASCLVEPTRLAEFGPGTQLCVKKVSAGMSHTLVVTLQGKVFAWGSNSHGQLGLKGVARGDGADASSKSPSLLKTALKEEVVVDIAAGAQHSLCATEAGSVFVWGSNSGGGLGLGAPPVGPEQSSLPQQLPHLRGAVAVAASASGHVSVVLASHGDAVLFGCPANDARSTAAGGTAPYMAADLNFHLPVRVRRRIRKCSSQSVNDDIDEDWQQARGSGVGSPLRTVALSADSAFAIDASGVLWVWPLRGPRPCTAEIAKLLPQPPVSPGASSGKASTGTCPEDLLCLSAGISSVAVADRLDALWVTDRSSSACLWRLSRFAAASWHVQRDEHLTQVSSIMCGPQNQAAVVSYRRPPPPMSQSSACANSSSGHDDLGNMITDEEQNAGKERGAVGLIGPPSLQLLCENALCRSLSPRNFSQACEIAWELRLPGLLDYTFTFLSTNAAFMFSRQQLPALAQLPLEVLVAFELTLTGTLVAPSAALDAVDILELLPVHDDGDLAAAPVSAPDASLRRRQGRRNGGGSGSPKVPVPGEGPPASLETLYSPSFVADRSPCGLSPELQVAPMCEKEWVEVRNIRRKPSNSQGKDSPQQSPASFAKEVATLPSLEAQLPAPTRTATLSDFIRPKKSKAPKEGPSGILADVLKVAPRWAEVPAVESATDFRKILAEETGESGGGSVQRTRGMESKTATSDPTHCSWGRDAMPSEQLKGESLYDIQAKEKDEQRRSAEAAEIRELEAMFAALEVAELQEIREAEEKELGSKPLKEDPGQEDGLPCSVSATRGGSYGRGGASKSRGRGGSGGSGSRGRGGHGNATSESRVHGWSSWYSGSWNSKGSGSAWSTSSWRAGRHEGAAGQQHSEACAETTQWAAKDNDKS